MGPVLNQTVPAYANIYLQYAFHVFAIVITFAHNSSQACTFASVIGNIEEGTSLETSDNSEVHRWISLSHIHTERVPWIPVGQDARILHCLPASIIGDLSL